MSIYLFIILSILLLYFKQTHVQVRRLDKFLEALHAQLLTCRRSHGRCCSRARSWWPRALHPCANKWLGSTSSRFLDSIWCDIACGACMAPSGKCACALVRSRWCGRPVCAVNHILWMRILEYTLWRGIKTKGCIALGDWAIIMFCKSIGHDIVFKHVERRLVPLESAKTEWVVHPSTAQCMRKAWFAYWSPCFYTTSQCSQYSLEHSHTFTPIKLGSP